MELINHVVSFAHGPLMSAILFLLLSASEILGTFDKFKNSSLFCLAKDLLKKMMDKLGSKLP